MSSTGIVESLVHKRKKKKNESFVEAVSFESFVHFLSQNPMLFDKGNKNGKDNDLKDILEKAIEEELGNEKGLCTVHGL